MKPINMAVGLGEDAGLRPLGRLARNRDRLVLAQCIQDKSPNLRVIMLSPSTRFTPLNCGVGGGALPADVNPGPANELRNDGAAKYSL